MSHMICSSCLYVPEDGKASREIRLEKRGTSKPCCKTDKQVKFNLSVCGANSHVSHSGLMSTYVQTDLTVLITIQSGIYDMPCPDADERLRFPKHQKCCEILITRTTLRRPFSYPSQTLKLRVCT